MDTAENGRYPRPHASRRAGKPIGAQARTGLAFLLVAVATVLAYWQGLKGPFLLDDGITFPIIERWIAGQANLYEVVLGRGSPWTGRPIAMATFALSAWWGGFTPEAFKAGNLALHILCGLLAWQVIKQILVMSSIGREKANWISLAIASLWLLHPMNMSTVLYAVQRMSQLSALFVLAAVLTYLLARNAQNEGRHAQARSSLFVTVPALVAAGALAKQNAVVAPILCLALEFTVLQRHRAPAATRAFLLLSVAAPALLAAAWLILNPDWLSTGYSEWGFTLKERLLSQARAITSYMGMLFDLAPAPGIYHDDFALSRTLLGAPAPWPSMLLIAATTTAAIVLRKRQPVFAAGWLCFLGAHSVESGILPLELYYEHRNYLPSIFLLVSVAGLILAISRPLRESIASRAAGYALPSFLAVLLMVVGYCTWRASPDWSSMQSIVARAQVDHPDSLRLRYDIGSIAIQSGDFAGNAQVMQALGNSGNPRVAALGRAGAVYADCLAGTPVTPDRLERLAAGWPPSATVLDVQALRRVTEASRLPACSGLSAADQARMLDRILDAIASQPEQARPKWLLYHLAAQVHARNGDLRHATAYARTAWTGSRGDQPIGILLADLLLAQSRYPEALAVVRELERRIKPYDSLGRSELARLTARLSLPPAERAVQ